MSRAQEAGLILRDGTRTVRRLFADSRVPWWIKGALAVAALPIPGPVDELIGGACVWWLARRSPDLVAEHWNAVRRERRCRPELNAPRTLVFRDASVETQRDDRVKKQPSETTLKEDEK
jgi:hypothetical protein